MDIKSKIINKLMSPPLTALGSQYSMVFSAHDDNSQPSEYLISLSLTVLEKAFREVSLEDIRQREKKTPYYVNVWPGEHYKLLAALVLTLKPHLIIEIGTGGGLSALSMTKYLPEDGQVITFDLIDWHNNPASCLEESDFQSGRLIQYLDDLSEIAVVNKYKPLIEAADIIFIDAAKDGVMEQKFLDNFKSISFKNSPLLIFDDIRLWNMLKIWRDISQPKLDLTSFGHWSGTGLVEWKNG